MRFSSSRGCWRERLCAYLTMAADRNWLGLGRLARPSDPHCFQLPREPDDPCTAETVKRGGSARCGRGAGKRRRQREQLSSPSAPLDRDQESESHSDCLGSTRRHGNMVSFTWRGHGKLQTLPSSFEHCIENFLRKDPSEDAISTSWPNQDSLCLNGHGIARNAPARGRETMA